MNKKLNKTQRRHVASLFIEEVSVPMLILATTVMFTSLTTFVKNYSPIENIVLAMSVMAIPILGVSIFTRRAVLIFEPKLKKVPKNIENFELAGFTLSAMSLFGFLATFGVWLGILSFLTGALAMTIHTRYIGRVRKKTQGVGDK